MHNVKIVSGGRQIPPGSFKLISVEEMNDVFSQSSALKSAGILPLIHTVLAKNTFP